MSDIIELERRITAALDRLRQGIDRMPTPGAATPQTVAGAPTPAVVDVPLAPEPAPSPVQPDPADAARIAALEAQLSEEKTVTAQLEERVRVLKDRQDTKLAELEDTNERNKARLVKFDRDVQRLRQVNADLRSINMQLREAMTQGVAEPHLINKAMMAELDALRAVREADAAEVDAVLDALKPIVEEAR